MPPTPRPALSEPAAHPAIVFVRAVKTARIERGDSRSAISQLICGEGDRDTAIDDANQDQIQKTDLIDPGQVFPGQVFVLPSEDAIKAGQTHKRG